MRNSKTLGIIIKRKNFFEADKLLTVLSPTDGKIQLKAKSVRKITSRRLAHLELLNLVTFSIYKKNNNTPLAIDAYSYQTYPHIKSDLIKSNLSYHICEIVDNLVPAGTESKNTFYLVKKVFDDLETAKDHFYAIVHDFELNLLISLGFSAPEQNLKGSKASLFIENILERKLKAREIIKKINFD